MNQSKAIQNNIIQFNAIQFNIMQFSSNQTPSIYLINKLQYCSWNNVPMLTTFGLRLPLIYLSKKYSGTSPSKYWSHSFSISGLSVHLTWDSKYYSDLESQLIMFLPSWWLCFQIADKHLWTISLTSFLM